MSSDDGLEQSDETARNQSTNEKEPVTPQRLEDVNDPDADDVPTTPHPGPGGG